MKAITALRLVMLSLLLLALQGNRSSPKDVGEGEAASVAGRQVPNARRSASRALQVTPQARPVEASALAAIEAETDSDRRSDLLEQVVESVADADLPAMLDSLTREGSPGTAELRQLLVRRWAEGDAPAAAVWAVRLSNGAFSRAALEQVAIAWANTDLSAAAGWVHAWPEGDNKESATLDLAYEAARTEPTDALELASSLPPTRERDDLLVLAVSQWSVIDSGTAAAWAMNVLDSSLRQRLVAAVAVASAEQDGAGAATLAASAIGAGDEQERAAVSIVQRWAQNSPQAAVAWVSQFPDLPYRDAAVRNLLALWTGQGADGEVIRIDGESFRAQEPMPSYR